MILDKQLMFSEAQALTSTDAASTNVLDLGALGYGDSGNSPMEVFVRVGTAFADGTSVLIKLQSATDAAFTTPVDSSVQETVLTAALTANAVVLKARLPYGLKRYVRLYYDVTGTFTAGKFTAGLILDRQAGIGG